VSEPFATGFLHRPAKPSADCLVITHGAGSNCQAPLLRAVADALSGATWNVYRFDLPFRRKRPHGPPSPATANEDREGIRAAVRSIKSVFSGAILLGGHSYGGRQSSMAASEDPQLADGLLLLSYPLHPPNKPANLRTAHFPNIRTKTLFVHGSRDPFGSIQELRAGMAGIPAISSLQVVEGAGHELGRIPAKTAQEISTWVQQFFGSED
jgi:predicted alpha/beta-hydrolase family hydrolase